MSPVVKVLHLMTFLSESYCTYEYIDDISLEQENGVYPIDKLWIFHGFSIVIKELFHCNKIKLQKLLDKGEESLTDDSDLLSIIKDIRKIKHVLDLCDNHEHINGKKII